VEYVPLASILPKPINPRTHSWQQIEALAHSIEAFGFNAPILVDGENRVVAGHARLEAARLLGLQEVPVIRLDHLTEAQAKAYMLADNKLTDRSGWDDAKVAIVLKALSEMELEFEIEATGFETAEIDLRIQSLDPIEDASDSVRRSRPRLPGGSWVSKASTACCSPAAIVRAECANTSKAMSCRRWSRNSLRPACRRRRSAMAFCSPRAAAPPMAGAPSCLAAGPPRSLGRLNARAGRSGASFASGTRITTAHMRMEPETLPVSCRCKVRSHAHWPGLKTSSTFPQMLSTVIAK
jgi:ParB-like nuclease domain